MNSAGAALKKSSTRFGISGTASAKLVLKNSATSAALLSAAKLTSPSNGKTQVQVKEPSTLAIASNKPWPRGQTCKTLWSITYEPSGAAGILSSLYPASRNDCV